MIQILIDFAPLCTKSYSMKVTVRGGASECAWASKWGDYLEYFWHTFCVLKAGVQEWEGEGREVGS